MFTASTSVNSATAHSHALHPTQLCYVGILSSGLQLISSVFAHRKSYFIFNAL